MPSLLDAAVPLINGRAYSYADIVPTVNGYTPMSCTKISWKVKREKKNNYGLGRNPTSRGYGTKTYEAELEMSLEDVIAIQRTVPSNDLTDVKPFPIVVSWQPEDGAPVTVTLLYCEFVEFGVDTSNGDTDTKVKLPLIIAGIK